MTPRTTGTFLFIFVWAIELTACFVFNSHRYVAWGCDVGPDGALYVAVDRDYHPEEGSQANYTTPPGPCAEPGCSRRKTGVIMRVQFAGAGAGTDTAAPPDAMITQEFYTKGEHLARPSGLTFNADLSLIHI